MVILNGSSKHRLNSNDLNNYSVYFQNLYLNRIDDGDLKKILSFDCDILIFKEWPEKSDQTANIIESSYQLIAERNSSNTVAYSIYVRKI